MKSFSNHYEMQKCGPFKHFDIFIKYVCIFSLHIPVFVFTKYGRSKLQRLFTLRRLQLLALLYQLRENNYRRLLAAWICITIFSKIKKATNQSLYKYKQAYFSEISRVLIDRCSKIQEKRYSNTYSLVLKEKHVSLVPHMTLGPNLLPTRELPGVALVALFHIFS